jgi:hypothetical protein
MPRASSLNYPRFAAAGVRGGHDTLQRGATGQPSTSQPLTMGRPPRPRPAQATTTARSRRPNRPTTAPGPVAR